jgi:hypothetical protein
MSPQKGEVTMPKVCCRCGRLAELPAVAGDLPDGRRVALCLDCDAEFLAACRGLVAALDKMARALALGLGLAAALADYVEAMGRLTAEDEP